MTDATDDSTIDPIAHRLLETCECVRSASANLVDFYDVGEWDEHPKQELLEILNAVANHGVIKVGFPGEDDYYEWLLDQFLSEGAECSKILACEHISLRTPSRSLQLVNAGNDKAHTVMYNGEHLPIEQDGIVTQIIYESLIAGVHASSIGSFHKKFAGALTPYMAVEIDYGDQARLRTDELDISLIDAYLFELASSHGISFRKTGFASYSDELEWMVDLPEIRLRPLLPTNEGIRLYLAAAQVDDPSLRFFSFYKVLEHFAPTVLNLEAHDSLRKKLDGPAALSPDGRFIREVFQLSKGFDQRRNDRDMIKGVLLTCIDLPSINEFVPTAIKKEVGADTQPKDIETYCRNLAECIYSTRNQVAHAKAHYTSTGTECPANELPTLTQFVEAAAAQAIRWYNRLPDHQRSELE